MCNWFVYIVKCSDDTLYSGISTDVQKRIKVHNLGKGAKYCRGRGPVVLICSAGPFSKSTALRVEATVKKKPTKEKVKFLRSLSNL